MLKKEVILEGLDCANCAAKIEDEVNKLNGVKAYNELHEQDIDFRN